MTGKLEVKQEPAMRATPWRLTEQMAARCSVGMHRFPLVSGREAPIFW